MNFLNLTLLLFVVVLVAVVQVVKSCHKNTDCSSGWCTGGTFWRSGRCDPKRSNGAACRKYGWPSQCDDKSCSAGFSTCDFCGKALAGRKCSNNKECTTGWCSGVNTWPCKGTCDSKRNDGSACRKTRTGQCDDNSCVSRVSTCGICGKAGMGQWCSNNLDCSTGWCNGKVTWPCKGKCTAKPDVADGRPCRRRWNGRCDDNSCKSKFSTCGNCGNAGFRQTCGKNSDCKSGLCGGLATWPCKGRCKARPKSDPAECMESLTDTIFDLDADARSAAFETLYALKFSRLAHAGREKARIDLINLIQSSTKLKTEFVNWAEKNELLSVIKKESIKAGVKKGTSVAADKLISYSLNAYIEQQIILSTTKGGPKFAGAGVKLGTKLIGVNARVSAAAGARAAFTGVDFVGRYGATTVGKAVGKTTLKAAAIIPGISAAVGESLARVITSQAGITNHHAVNTFAVAGAVAGGAAAGAIMGGPVGAAVGGAAGVATWGIGVTIDALYTSGLGMKGPSDNWVYIKTGKVDGNVGFLTYSASDTIYFQSYWQEYRSADLCVFFMSAGNARKAPFQVSVRDRQDREIVNLKKVYHRDFIHVGKNSRGRLTVAHAKGELWENAGGTVDLHY